MKVPVKGLLRNTLKPAYNENRDTAYAYSPGLALLPSPAGAQASLQNNENMLVPQFPSLLPSGNLTATRFVKRTS